MDEPFVEYKRPAKTPRVSYSRDDAAAASDLGHSTTTMDDLDDSALGVILGYLEDRFRFVAGVNRRFRRLHPYRSYYGRDTNVGVAAESISMADLMLAERGPTNCDKFLATVVRKGNHDTISWLFSEATTKHGFVFRTEYGADIAIRCGNLPVLQLLLSQDPHFRLDRYNQVCHEAARKGQLEILAWMCSQNPPAFVDADAIELAIEYGHLEAVKLLRSRNPPCPWNQYACLAAANMGNLETLKWLQSQNPPCPWNPNRCLIEAKRQGCPEVVQWLEEHERQNPASWDWRLSLNLEGFRGSP